MTTRHIVAMGGGGFSMEPGNPLLDDFILGLTGKRRPKACFLATASGDGICYGIDPQFRPGVNGQPGVLKTIWEFDVKKGLLDPQTGKPGYR